MPGIPQVVAADPAFAAQYKAPPSKSEIKFLEGGVREGIDETYVGADGTPRQTTDLGGGILYEVRQTGDKAIADFNRFDLATGDKIRFDQPGANALILARIYDNKPSQIAGAIEAKGGVVLSNGMGMIFHEGAQVDVGTLVATSLPISKAQFDDGLLVRSVDNGFAQLGESIPANAQQPNFGTDNPNAVVAQISYVPPLTTTSETIRNSVFFGQDQVFDRVITALGLYMYDRTGEVVDPRTGETVVLGDLGTPEDSPENRYALDRVTAYVRNSEGEEDELGFTYGVPASYDLRGLGLERGLEALARGDLQGAEALGQAIASYDGLNPLAFASLPRRAENPTFNFGSGEGLFGAPSAQEEITAARAAVAALIDVYVEAFNTGRTIEVNGFVINPNGVDLTARWESYTSAPPGVWVQQGAKLEAHRGALIDLPATPAVDESETTVAGKLMLFGQNVRNDGELRADEGQVIVGAGERVRLLASTDPMVRGIRSEVSANVLSGVTLSGAFDPIAERAAEVGFAVGNTGTIEAVRGNVQIVGREIAQFGEVISTTSARLPGTVQLQGSYGFARISGSGNSEGITANLLGGTVVLGPDSLTEIYVEGAEGSPYGLTDASTLREAASRLEAGSFASALDVFGLDIVLQSGARVAARGGGVDLITDSRGVGALRYDQPRPGESTTTAPGGSITVFGGAEVDVSGAVALRNVADNVIEAEVRSNELQDSPRQQGGILQGQVLSIDIREGTRIADYTGALSNRPVTAADLLTTGGLARVQSSTLHVDAGAVFDVSGGGVDYAAGVVETTKLIDSDGRLVDISNADPNIIYKSISPEIDDRLEIQDGYFQGADAGTLRINTNVGVLWGEVRAGVTLSAEQQGGLLDFAPLAPAPLLADPERAAELPSYERPVAGVLALNNADPFPYTGQQFVIVTDGPGAYQGVALDLFGGIIRDEAPEVFDPLDGFEHPERRLFLSDDFLSGGFSLVQTNVGGGLPSDDGALPAVMRIDDNVSITLAAGGQLALQGGPGVSFNPLVPSIGPSIRIGENVRLAAAGGQISLAGAVVGDGFQIDVSGDWVNEGVSGRAQEGVGAGGRADYVDIRIDGGSASLSSVELLGRASLDVSGGGWRRLSEPTDSYVLTEGDGGSISLSGGSVVGRLSADYLERVSFNAAALGVAGSLSLRTGDDILIVADPADAAAVPLNPVPPEVVAYWQRDQLLALAGEDPAAFALQTRDEQNARLVAIYNGLGAAQQAELIQAARVLVDELQTGPSPDGQPLLFGPNSRVFNTQRLVLDDSFFSQGFSSYSLKTEGANISTSSIILPTDNRVSGREIRVLAGVDLRPTAPNRMVTAAFAEAATGADIRSFSTLEPSLPGEEVPVNLTLDAGAGPSITSTNTFLYDVGGVIRIDDGASITLTPGSNLRLVGRRGLIAGDLTALAGSIDIAMEERLFIEDGAYLNVGGYGWTRAHTQADGRRVVDGHVMNAGRIGLFAPWLVVDAGATLDISGASAEYDVPIGYFNGLAMFGRREIGGDAGLLRITGEYGYMLGELRAAGGTTGALGGRIDFGGGYGGSLGLVPSITENPKFYENVTVLEQGGAHNGNGAPATSVATIAARIIDLAARCGFGGSPCLTLDELLRDSQFGGRDLPAVLEAVPLFDEPPASFGPERDAAILAAKQRLTDFLRAAFEAEDYVAGPHGTAVLANAPERPADVTFDAFNPARTQQVVLSGQIVVPAGYQVQTSEEAFRATLAALFAVPGDPTAPPLDPEGGGFDRPIYARFREAGDFVVDASRINAGAFDTIGLGGLGAAFAANDDASSSYTDLRVAAGEHGALAARRSVRLRTDHLLADGDLTIEAPYVTIFQAQSVPSFAGARTEDGRLEIAADIIDFNSGLGTLGFSDVLLSAREIRGTQGSLSGMDRLTLRAGQIYPATGGGTAGGGGMQFFADELIRVERRAGLVAAPLSAGGALTLTAPTIEQFGVLRAPFGTITLDGRTITVGEGSLTQVSGAGLSVFWGSTLDGAEWFGPMPPSFAPLLGGGTLSPPEKRITFAGDNVDIQAGSVVDVRGGGELLAVEFVPGPGGSADSLAPTPTYRNVEAEGNVYAVIAGTGPSLTAPYDIGLTPNGPMELGRSVYLSGYEGLPAGLYTLLPARYALLPGGHRVTLAEGALPVGTSLLQDDGSYLMGGRFTVASTPIAEDISRTFLVEPGAVARERSEFLISSATTFFSSDLFIQGARRRGADEDISPERPVDAGALVFNARKSIDVAGDILAQPIPGARGGLVDVTAEKIVVYSEGIDTSDLGEDYLRLTTRFFDDLGVDSILIGGIREEGGNLIRSGYETMFSRGQGELPVGSETIVIRTNASAPLSGNEILLAANSEIRVDDGSVLQTRLGGTGRGETLLLAPYLPANVDERTGEVYVPGIHRGSFLRLSGIEAVPVERDVRNGGAGAYDFETDAALTIGANVRLIGGRDLVFDTTGSPVVDSSAFLDGDTIRATADRLLFGDAPAGTSGFVINQATLEQLRDAEVLVLRANTTADFYGDVALDIGREDSLLRLDAGAFRGFGSNAVLSADRILLENSGGAIAARPDDPTESEGTFRLVAGDVLSLGEGEKRIAGFGALELEAAERIVLEGEGSLDALAASFATRELTANGGARQTVTLDGDLVARQLGAPLEDPAVRGLGALLDITATSIDWDLPTILRGGAMSLTATSGDLTLGDRARLDLSGAVIPFYDIDEPLPGGTLRLTAAGDISASAAAVLDVSGADVAGGDAGRIIVRTTTDEPGDLPGSVDLAAALLGSARAGARAGAFEIDAGVISDLTGLNARLTAGGFTERRSFVLGAGDIVIDGAVNARLLRFEARRGEVTVNADAVLDASAEEGGSISLSGSEGVFIAGGAQLLARGLGEAGDGGVIRVQAGDEGRLAIGEARFDVSGNGTLAAGVREGTVYLRAPRTDADVALTDWTATVTGGLTLLEAYKAYDANPDGTVDDPLIAAAILDTGEFMAGVGAIRARLGVEADNRFWVTPGVEFRSEGAMELTGTWDSSKLRYDAVEGLTPYRDGDAVQIGVSALEGLRGSHVLYRGVPGVLTLRAGGKLTISAHINDGFKEALRTSDGYAEADYASADAVPNKLTDDFSWSYNLVAGADLAAGDPLARTGAEGDLEIGLTSGLIKLLDYITRYDENYNPVTVIVDRGSEMRPKAEGAFVRTGTGTIQVASARDVVFLDDYSTIYTAGVNAAPVADIDGDGQIDFETPWRLGQTAGDPFSGEGGQDVWYGGPLTVFRAYYLENGGRVSMDIGRDFVGADDAFPLGQYGWNMWRGRVELDSLNLISGSADAAFATRTLADGTFERLNASSWINFEGVYAQRLRIRSPFGGSTTFTSQRRHGFNSGVGALGGNDVTVTAGRDLVNLAASLPTTLRVAEYGPEGARQKEAVTNGGGDLRVEAGRDIVGGGYHIGHGEASIEATGSLRGFFRPEYADGNGERETFLERTAVVMGDADVRIRAGGDIEFGAITGLHLLNPFTNPPDPTFSDILADVAFQYESGSYFGGLGSVVAPTGYVPQWTDYTAFSQFSVQSVGGDVRLYTEGEAGGVDYGTRDVRRVMYENSFFLPSRTKFSTPAGGIASQVYSLAFDATPRSELVFLTRDDMTFTMADVRYDPGSSGGGQEPFLQSGADYKVTPRALNPIVKYGEPATFFTPFPTASVEGFWANDTYSINGPNYPSYEAAANGYTDYTKLTGGVHAGNPFHNSLYSLEGTVGGSMFPGSIYGDSPLHFTNETRIRMGGDYRIPLLTIQHADEADVSVIEVGGSIYLPYDYLDRGAAIIGQGPGRLDIMARGELWMAGNENGEGRGIFTIGELPLRPDGRQWDPSLAGRRDMDISVLVGLTEKPKAGEFIDRYFSPGGADSPDFLREVYVPDPLYEILGLPRELAPLTSTAAALKDGTEVTIYAPQLVNFMRARAGQALLPERTTEGVTDNPDTTNVEFDRALTNAEKLAAIDPEEYRAAWTAFQALDEDGQRGLVLQVFNEELRTAGREAVGASRFTDPDQTRNGDPTRGYDATAVLFPGAQRRPDEALAEGEVDWGGRRNPDTSATRGNLVLDNNQIRSRGGGEINLVVPGGFVQLASLSVGGTDPDASGIVTIADGGINAFVYGSYANNQSRTMTAAGGNILIWSQYGDIDAGRGRKTSSGAPPTRFVTDADLVTTQRIAGLPTGAGVATLARLNGRPGGDVDLYAFNGIVNAGDAGIRASGDLFVGAIQILGLDNITVGGVTNIDLKPEQGETLAPLNVEDFADAAVKKAIETAMESAERAVRRSLFNLDIDFLGERDVSQ